MEDKCPFCGGIKGSHHKNCYKRQITDLKSQLTTLAAENGALKASLKIIANTSLETWSPTDTLKEVKKIAEKALSTPPGEWVSVRREALEKGRKYVDRGFDYSEDHDDPRSWIQELLDEHEK